MAYFPQLSTDCLAQYPTRRVSGHRTVTNETPGGALVLGTDPEARAMEWELAYAGLTEGEAAALRSLFEECEGSLQPFVFPDPAGNLLARSEEFTLVPWSSSPLLQWTGNIADPLGTTRASRATNNGAIAQSVEQSIDCPGSRTLCFSVWARSPQAVSIVLRRSAGAESHSEVLLVGPSWKRWQLSGDLNTSAAPVRFSVEIPAGATVDVFGAQAEPQHAASDYRKTAQQSGVYSQAHFAQDELTLTADGWQSYSTRLQIHAQIGG